MACALSGAVIAAGPVGFAYALSQSDVSGLLFSLPFVSFSVLWQVKLYGYLDSVHQIRLSADGVCEFRSLLHRRRLHVGRMVSLRLADGEENPPIYELRHQAGKLRLLETFDFADFVAQVAVLNPAIQLEGFDDDRR